MTNEDGKQRVEWGTEKLLKTQQAIDDDPHDLESWNILIREANVKTIAEVRPFYEQLVGAFPTCGRYWRLYIEQEMKGRNYEKVEQLFQRCLIKILNIELWKLYLQYVRETKSALPSYKEKMAQAYDFALDKIGMDLNSFIVWSDYVAFLKSVDAVGSYAENQKITAIRKVYQRAVINPMLQIEQMWKDYMLFEQNINPIIADKMAMERSKDYMNARRVAKEYEAAIRGINKHAPSIPPSGHPEEVRQVELWKKYINWEKSNPLRSEDTCLVTRRVMFAFEQCLLCLGHHADVWYEAAQFLEQSSIVLQEKGDVTAVKLFTEEASNIYERATTGVLSQNMLLFFAYADFEEGRGRHKYDKVHQIYTKFIDIPDVEPTLAYVQYMKFARRAEGIKSARTIFKRAREDPRCKYHVFVAAALMEYYCSKDKNIAFRIFELGLKKFGDDPDYVRCYIDYLSHLNDDNNTRVLFERVLSSGSLDAEKSVDIWNRFLEFESNIGDLTSIVKVEKRRCDVLQGIKEFEGRETARLVDRYRFLDLYPCPAPELKSIGYNDVARTSRSFHPSVNQTFLRDLEENVERIHRPDLSQMIPYKPKINAYPGEHPVPGGAFPKPPAAGHFCSLIPPSHKFMGPFVHVDYLITIFERIQLPDKPPAPAGDVDDLKLFDLAKSVHWVLDDGLPAFMRRKRKRAGAGDDSDDDDIAAPPRHDIYRQRQQRKIK